MWNADEFGGGEPPSRPLVAVVEQHVDAGARERFVQAVGGAPDGVVATVAERHDREPERRDRIGPDDPAVVVALLDRGADDARHADAVAAHLEEPRLPLLVEESGFHRLRVPRAELEDVADLAGAHDLEGGLPLP